MEILLKTGRDDGDDMGVSGSGIVLDQGSSK